MAKDKQTSPARIAINWLKTEYERGRSFTNRYDLAGGLQLAHPGEYDKTPVWRIVEWDRQARYERAAGLNFTTQPVWVKRYERTPVAGTMLRDTTQTPRLRELQTRIDNQLLMARAAAAQPDSTSREAVQAATLGYMAQMARDVVNAT